MLTTHSVSFNFLPVCAPAKESVQGYQYWSAQQVVIPLWLTSRSDWHKTVGTSCRDYHGPHHDHNQHRRALLAATHFLCQGHRHLLGHVLCLCFRGAVGIRGRQLHLLGCSSQAESQTIQCPSRSPS